MLLDAYYQREGPLPADPEILYRITKAHKRHEKKAVDLVVVTYFRTLDKHITNKRADQEILNYQSQCAANRRPIRQRIVPESSLEPRVQLKELDVRLVDNFKKGNGHDNCVAVVANGKPCGKPGAYWRAGKAHCRDHGPL